MNYFKILIWPVVVMLLGISATNTAINYLSDKNAIDAEIATSKCWFEMRKIPYDEQQLSYCGNIQSYKYGQGE